MIWFLIPTILFFAFMIWQMPRESDIKKRERFNDQPVSFGAEDEN